MDISKQTVITIISFFTAIALLLVAILNFTPYFKPNELEMPALTFQNNTLDVILKNPTDSDILINEVNIELLNYSYDRNAPPIVSTLTPTNPMDNCIEFPDHIGENKSKQIAFVVKSHEYDRMNITYCDFCRPFLNNEKREIKITIFYDQDKYLTKNINHYCP